MNERIIEWRTYGETMIEPLTMSIALVLLAFAMFGNRRSVLGPFIAGIAILPYAQRIVIADLDFPMIRMMVCLAWLPLLVTREGPFRWTKLSQIDKWLIGWVVCGAVIYVARKGDGGAVAYRAGIMLDAFAMYFLVRKRVWRTDQFTSAMVACGWLSVIIGSAMMIEFTTGRNYFSVFGTANEHTIMREGEYRAMASFSHPILAGTFGALTLAMMLGLWNIGRRWRVHAVPGMVGSVMMVIACNSSGPIIAAAFGVGCWWTWRVRQHLPRLLGATVVIALVVHFGRSKPIWHLILRLGEVMGSGTGYHRYHLIDATFREWRSWLLVGTNNTASWGWGLQDLTNQWVFEAVNGGLLTLMAFNGLLFVAFRGLWRTYEALRRTDSIAPARRRQLLFLCWTQAVVLAVYCMSFISVALFGQMNSFFYIQLALIANYVELPEIRTALAGGPAASVARDTRSEADEALAANEAPGPRPAPDSGAGAAVGNVLTLRRTSRRD